ncbi:hypothetical protein E4U32_003289 [Claviceps aff. humidiphila group G2b]|nr:hypothetical protein E4U32_003289 [Claviceps aff. humidiphila group G2b]
MTTPPQPKVLLFDIGGVCVLSPFQAILDYELQNSIPPGWINYSISRSKPHGAWHNLERGSIPLNEAFFTAFSLDLHRPDYWIDFHARQAAAKTPPPPPSSSSSSSSPSTLSSPSSSSSSPSSLQRDIPPLPRVNTQQLFSNMMTLAQQPDPWMAPALDILKQNGKYILGALSNTVVFPEGHPLHRGLEGPDAEDTLRRRFDVFISSAHVGVRKPEDRMYTLAVEMLDSFAKDHAATERGTKNDWAAGVKSEDIVFLDDIGENLKAAKRHGFRTLKVQLGRTEEAVGELERVTGLVLNRTVAAKM